MTSKLPNPDRKSKISHARTKNRDGLSEPDERKSA
jgi:hypothetical protein